MLARHTPDLPPNPRAPWASVSPRDRGIHEVFAELVPSVGDLEAVRTEAETLTYLALDAHSNRIARYLRSLGVGVGDRVAMLLDRSAALITWQLGVLKAGAICVPIDVMAPAERVAFFLQDSGAGILICGDLAKGATYQATTRVIDVAEAERALVDIDATRVAQHVQGDQAAYILYTSGSTGIPKGVLVPHRGVIRLVRGQSYFPAGPGNCTLLLASPGFDGTNYEIWSALLNGGTCAVFSDRFVDYNRLKQRIESLGVTCVWFSTGLFNQIVDRRPDVLASLKHILVGGEALSAVHMQRAMAYLPQVHFANGYGPTECATFAVSWILDEPSAWGTDSVPLGWPLAQTECWIVDEQLKPVAPGEVGELLLGGDGLALGYLNRPELTAERFIRNPFSDDPDARLYHTGDRCFALPSGMIGYVGRNDDQVKLNGFRVELGEVESVIRRADGVVNAAVVVHQFPSGARALVAGLVLDDASHSSPATVQAWLTTQLPDIMRPTRLLRVDKLPLTLNGKVDRRALGAELSALLSTERTSSEEAAPDDTSTLTALERQLLELFRTTLHDPTLSVGTDFFRVGGDSLVAAELESEIERALDRKIPGGTLYRHRTVRALAATLSQQETTADVLIGSGTGTPVLWLPDMIGCGGMPQPLASALAARHPIYDRFCFPSDERELAGMSIESIAATLLPQALAIVPSGPVILAGYSFGSYLAFEMARLLHQRDRTVEHVVLWDSLPETDSSERSPVEMAVFATAKLLRSDTWSDTRWLRDRWRYMRSLLQERLERPVALAGSADVRRHRASLQLQGERLLSKYRPQPYAGPVTLLACTRTGDSVRTRSVSPQQRWAAALSPDNLRVVSIDCHHSDVFTPEWIGRFVDETLSAMSPSLSAAG